MLKQGCVFLLIAAVFVHGCTFSRLQPEAVDAQVLPLPKEWQAYYDYPSISLNANVVNEKVSKHYIHQTVEFDLAMPQALQKRTVEDIQAEVKEKEESEPKYVRDLKLLYLNRVEFFIPKDVSDEEKRPVILISPILGGNLVVDWFAEYYAKKGYFAAIVHRKRMRWDDEQGIEQVEDYLRSSVIRTRQALDWVLTQPQVDTERVGAFGISYGAILQSVLSTVEPRIHYHIFAMPAGPLSEVIRYCPERQIKKMRKHVHNKYGWTGEMIEEKLEATLKSDPLLFASYVPRQKVFYYISLFDRVVGSHRSFELWRAMGKPSLKILPFGHYGGILFFPVLKSQSFRIFRDEFASER